MAIRFPVIELKIDGDRLDFDFAPLKGVPSSIPVQHGFPRPVLSSIFLASTDPCEFIWKFIEFSC